MKRLIWGVALCVACKGEPKAVPAATVGDAIVAKLTAFRDQMCACKGKSCGEEVDRAYKAASEQILDDVSNVPKTESSEVSGTRAFEIMQAYDACRVKITGGYGADADPAA